MTKEEKQLLGEKMIDRIQKYLEQLANDDKVSDTKLKHMQTAMYGCKMIIRDECELKHEQEIAVG